MTDPPPTRVLIEHAQQGDREALNELCSRYLPRVLTTVRIRLGASLRRKLESCDIVQDVMIDSLRKLDSFDFRTEGAFLKFLNRVVENRIRDQADRWLTQKRSPARESPLVTPSDTSPAAIEIQEGSTLSPSKVVSLGEDLSRLELAMDRLGEESPEYRELLVATKIEGQTYREIAEDLNTSEDAVRMRVTRAMRSLTNIYSDLDGD